MMTAVHFGWVLNAGPTRGMEPSRFLEITREQIALVGEQIDSLWFTDHLQFGHSPVLEGWTALTYLAALYPQYRIGHMVLCQSFRNPALLAKMGATLQYLSGGRFLLGIGAGWHEEEYRAYNYPFPEPRTRIEQLEEALQIVRALWSQEQATFEGRHYRVHSAYCEPKPEPVPPIIVGGLGPRLLQIVARYADGWNAAWVKPEAYRERLATFERACQQLGRDPSRIERSWFGRCICVPSPQEAARLQGRGLLGTPDQIAEQIQAYIDLGVTSFMLGSWELEDLQTVELLARQVLPRFRPGTGTA
ncbi:MAG: LLM class flavin-dependent oxidoreductase [Thermogemmatispora sp.]|uniref:LLM class flavin-dependent oxidoreductase n=1 Tax=Thermogemmatispora sp. TaxID=1968838 RepID=UPI00262AC7B3|nr:LLM class flavin-dependent oxidoreductase [Thermogemmatispora sp.]MBX5458048.1 LLM class flavin-dependent oxidoreductase [Thermogemmatispora sp.]